MRNLMKVKDKPDLRRDLSTGMIVNINKDKHRHHLQQVEQVKTERKRINDLENDVQEIKMMLKKLLENGSHG